jgi:hypothetical protein
MEALASADPTQEKPVPLLKWTEDRLMKLLNEALPRKQAGRVDYDALSTLFIMAYDGFCATSSGCPTRCATFCWERRRSGKALENRPIRWGIRPERCDRIGGSGPFRSFPVTNDDSIQVTARLDQRKRKAA